MSARQLVAGVALALTATTCMPANAADTAAKLRIEATDDGYYAWADNPLPGPIEVMLRYRQRHNTSASPALPARATVPAGTSTVVAIFRVTDPARAVDFDLTLDSVPGNPSAQPRDVLYAMPLQRDQPAVIDQGFEGGFSHDDEENRYALDFAVPVGTPVLAARDGVVMQAVDRYDDTSTVDAAQSRRAPAPHALLDKANLIRVLHEDGSMALYAHLQRGGAITQPGQRVRTSQHIGWSGNSGFSTGPHLHFAVQVNRGMRLVSLPFRMEGVTER